MAISIEHLVWDSNFLERKIGKINLEKNYELEELNLSIHQVREQGYKLLYIFTLPEFALPDKLLLREKGKLVDQKVWFEKKITNENALMSDVNIIEFGNALPNNQLVTLSKQSGVYSRYKTDRQIGDEYFQKLYRLWIENSCNKTIAQKVYVYIENSTEVGLLTLTKEGTIGILAVDKLQRGKGIGKKLVAKAERYCIKNGLSSLRVATQLQNVKACDFYKNYGFQLAKIYNIYHFHF